MTSRRSLDNLVGAREQRRWHIEPERLRGFQVDQLQTQITFDNRSSHRWHTEAVGSSAQNLQLLWTFGWN
jgi:hypothetical protein